MATDTAAEAPPRTEPDPRKHVWQVPVFLLGVAVFVCAWRGWLPLGTPDPTADFERDLAGLRLAYERVTPDRDELKQRLADIAGRSDSFPKFATASRYSLGSGYVRLAELTGDLEEARAHWTLAKQYLDQVQAAQLADQADAPRLAFRAAKARAAIGLPVSASAAELKLHITLLANVPFGEEPGEAGRLQAALALRLNPPDLNTARAGLENYLQRTGIATPIVSLARGRLLLGELYARTKEFALAKNRLQQIGIDSPPEIVAPAKILLARTMYMTEAQPDWLGAARELEAVLALPNVAPPLRLTAAYHLGVCKLGTRESDAATKCFEEAVKGDGLEAQAAAVELAELYLKTTGDQQRAKRVAAVELLQSAFRGVADIKQLSGHPYFRRADIPPVFELGISVLTADGAFDSALKLIGVYAPLAAPGRDREKRAEVLGAWAVALQQQNGDFTPKAAAAAAEFEAVAALQPAASAKADVYRRAAGMHRLASDPAKAVETLQKVLQLPQLPDSITGPVWADLADSLIAAKRPDEVWPAFNQIMATATPVSTATRYRLAVQFAKGTQPGFAALGRQLYEQIAKQEKVSREEQSVHELALSELTHELIKSNNFAEAEVWARKQVATYATGPEAGLGKLFLGICLLQRAAGMTAATDTANADRMREEALALFKQITGDVEAKHARDKKLADRDYWLRLQSGLRILQTYQQLRKPNDLLAEAAPLLERHRGTVEELIIWSLVYHAFRQKNETGKMLQTRDQMKELFDRLPKDKFRAAEGEYSRAYWEKVWFSPEAKKG